MLTNLKPISQRRRQQPGAGRCSDQRKRLKPKVQCSSVRAFAMHNVDTKILHRRVEVFLDRARGVNIPVLGQLFLMLGMLVFLSLDGHLALIRLVADSFEMKPIASGGLSQETIWGLLEWSAQVTLTDRAEMGVPMLLGRATMKKRRLVVHPGRSFVLTGEERKMLKSEGSGE